MSFVDTWRRWMGAEERHALSKNDAWAMGEDWPGDPVHAGVSVSQELALRLSVVWRCIQLISGTIAAMPGQVTRMPAGSSVPEMVDRLPPWLHDPNPETSYFEHMERNAESLLMDGNAFNLITARMDNAFPAEMWTLHPNDVEVRKDTIGGPLYYVWRGSTRLERYSPANPGGDVLHIRLSTAGGVRGMSPLEAARQAVGLGLAAEKTGARFFGESMIANLGIELPEQSRTKENIDLMRETVKAAHRGAGKSFQPLIATGGGKFVKLSITPEEAQFLETRKFQVEDIARIYGVPSHMVGLEEKSTSWGTGIEAQATGFVRFTLLPYLTRLESAFSTLLPRGQFFEFDPTNLLRADSSTETEVLTKQLMNGVINWDEFRTKIRRPPRPGGSAFMVPLSQQILVGGKVPAPPPPPAPPSEPSPNGNGRAPANIGEGQ